MQAKPAGSKMLMWQGGPEMDSGARFEGLVLLLGSAAQLQDPLLLLMRTFLCQLLSVGAHLTCRMANIMHRELNMHLPFVRKHALTTFRFETGISALHRIMGKFSKAILLIQLN